VYDAAIRLSAPQSFIRRLS